MIITPKKLFKPFIIKTNSKLNSNTLFAKTHHLLPTYEGRTMTSALQPLSLCVSISALSLKCSNYVYKLNTN